MVKVVRVWEKRALVHLLDGAVSFRVGYTSYRPGDVFVKFPNEINVSRAVIEETKQQILKEIGENEGAAGNSI